MAATCAVVRAPTSSVLEGFDVIGVQASQGTRGDRAQVGRLQLAGLSGRQGCNLVGVQRRELAVPRALRLPVVRLLICSVVRP